MKFKYEKYGIIMKQINVLLTVKISLLIVVNFISLSCGKVRTSSSSDIYIYGSGVTGSANFLSARGVLATQCMGCHVEWGNYSEQDYRNRYLVIQGSPVNSLIYYRIRGNDVGVNGDMPIGGSNISFDDMKKIKDWITLM